MIKGRREKFKREGRKKVNERKEEESMKGMMKERRETFKRKEGKKEKRRKEAWRQ